MVKLLQSQKGQLLMMGIAGIFLIILMTPILPQGVDWHIAFRPAVWEMLGGRSPYNIEGYFNAPWALIPLLPMAILPEPMGRATMIVVAVLALAYTAHRLGAKPISMLFLLISPPVLHGLLNANIDWLAVLGFILPPQIGLFFVSIKPQVGIAVGVYWLIMAWQKGGWREVLRVFAPFTIALLISFAMFGLWFLRFEREIDLWWNASLFPMSIPVGLTLLVTAIRKKRVEFAIAASPALSPYVLLHSWVGVLLAIVAHVPETIAAVTGLWILVIIQSGLLG